MKDYTYIINPETNQIVSLFSNEGSELLNQYISIFKVGGNGNKKLSYQISKNIQNDNDIKIDKTLGRFSKIVSKENEVYEKCKYINKGGAGEIYLYTDKGKKYIIKRLFKSSKKYLDNVLNINNYIISHFKRCHKSNFTKNVDNYILTYNKIFKGNENNTFLLSEYMDYGFHDYFINHRNKRYKDFLYNFKNTLKNLYYIICRLIDGLHCLHKMGLIHGDLKFGNLMLKFEDDIPSVKIIDVDGIGINEGKFKRKIINYTYFPPGTDIASEIRETDDVYIMGWIILQIFASYINYDIASLRPGSDKKIKVSEDTIKRIINKFFYKKDLKNLKKKTKKLILNMMNDDKQERWSMKKVKKHMEECISFIDEQKGLI